MFVLIYSWRLGYVLSYIGLDPQVGSSYDIEI